MLGVLQAFIDGLKAKDMSWVPIVDPAIMVDIGVGYRPYDLGLQMDIFIKDRVGVPYYGKVGKVPNHNLHRTLAKRSVCEHVVNAASWAPKHL